MDVLALFHDLQMDVLFRCNILQDEVYVAEKFAARVEPMVSSDNLISEIGN